MKIILVFFLSASIIIGCQDNCIRQNNSLILQIDSITVMNLDTLTIFSPSKIVNGPYYYKNNLVVLNEKGIIQSYSYDCLNHNKSFEELLNTKILEKIILKSDTLFGIDSLEQLHYFDFQQSCWSPINSKFLFYKYSPIFESEKYICYAFSNGEFGGSIDFYNKKKNQTRILFESPLSSIFEYQDTFYICTYDYDYEPQVLQIPNPDTLFLNVDSLLRYRFWNCRNCKWSPNYPSNQDRLYQTFDSKRPSEYLQFQYGFPLHSKFYHLILTEDELSLSLIEGQELKKIFSSTKDIPHVPYSKFYNSYKMNIWNQIKRESSFNLSKEYITSTFIQMDTSLIFIKWKTADRK